MPVASLALVTPLLGPWAGPDGQPVTFLVCTEGERVNAFIGPFYDEASIQRDLRGDACANAHFRTARIPADALVFTSTPFATATERCWALEWVEAWAARPGMRARYADDFAATFEEPF